MPYILDSRKYFFLFFSVISIAFAFWLCNFWPGIMGPDSFNQWNQMEQWQFDDWHPAFHTLFNWLITRIWDSPAAIAIVQIAMFSAVVSWQLVLFINRGMHFLIAFVICLLIALSPLHGSLAIFLIKDIPYTISFVFLTAILFRYAFPAKIGAVPFHLGDLALLILALILTAFFRHNGFPVALGVAIFMAIRWRNKFTLSAIGLFILLYGLIVGPLYNNILHVHTAGKNFAFAVTMLSHVAAHKTMGTYFTTEEDKFLTNLVPADQKWIYYPTDVSYTMIQIGLPKMYFLEDKNNAKTLILLAGKLSIRNPIATLRSIANMTPVLWDLRNLSGTFSVPSNLLLSADGQKVLTNQANHLLTSSSDKYAHKTIFPGIDVALVHYLDNFREIPAVASVSFHFYLLVFLVIISCVLHKSARDMIILYPVLLHIIFLVPTAPSLDFRYYYPVYITSQLFAPFLILRIINQHWHRASLATKRLRT